MALLIFFSKLFTFIGLLGLFGSTWGGPLVAWLIFVFTGKSTQSPVRLISSRSQLTVEGFVPVHNEEKILSQTLLSLLKASEVAECNLDLTVGLDHSTDKSHEIAQALGCNTQEHLGRPGKWFVLKGLIEKSTAEWIALVDAGSTWDPELLKAAVPYFLDPQVVCVAPTYSPQKAGLLESFFWRLEQHFKSIESKTGGPVTAHGATIFYRAQSLKAVLAQLGEDHWLNDDVVVPLLMRMSHPEHKLVYLTRPNRAWVSDIGVDLRMDSEYRRRKRMVTGNIQWVSEIFFKRLVQNPIASMIASRRVFRLFWAYWILFLSLGLIGYLIVHGFFNLPVVLFTSFFMVSAMLASNMLRRIFMAFLSGLQIPFAWKKWVSHRQGVLWA